MLAANSALVSAQEFNKSNEEICQSPPIRLIVPYTAGGVTDVIARSLSEKLSRELKQSVVVDNRAGAGATIGLEYLSRSPANGCTFAFSAISPLTLSPHIMSLGFDPINDVVPIASVMYSPIYVLGTKSLKVSTFESMIKLAQDNPGTVSVATSGYGSLGHLMVELIQQKAFTKLNHVPYKGSGGQSVADALSGQFDVLLVNPTSAINNLIDQGRFNLLAVGSIGRLKAYPNVKTLAEYGFSQANVVSEFGIFAPSKTSSKVVQRMSQLINRLLENPELSSQIANSQNVILQSSSKDFSKKIFTEYLKNQKLSKSIGLKASE